VSLTPGSQNCAEEAVVFKPSPLFQGRFSLCAEAEAEVVERDELVSEDVIIDTMDITNLGRTQVLEMLQDFQGDQALLLESFFQ
jgi:hypothetical protein